ncbi:hypothetical protein Zmor_000648 [Zophobas morio]|uniref:Uncharacterized protein n=1 Tax=Zophobas morio TaxID=2755281 RepID=A0AA38MQW9_9CUCU|nr:hypothetical protein Zmor_000648 [Zophobas morio]
MVYSVKQDTFLVISYRNGSFVNEKWLYSIIASKQEYLDKYRDLIIQESALEAHFSDVINGFVRIGSVDKGKSRLRPSVSEEVDDLRRLEQNLLTSLTRFPQQSRVPIAT